MDDDSGGVDDLTKPRLNLKIDLFLEDGKEFFEGEEVVFQVRRFFFMEEFFAQLSQSLSYAFDDDISGMDL
jgi:hypothetical protein